MDQWVSTLAFHEQQLFFGSLFWLGVLTGMYSTATQVHRTTIIVLAIASFIGLSYCDMQPTFLTSLSSLGLQQIFLANPPYLLLTSNCII